MWLSRSSLRGCLGVVAPRFLAAFHWFSVVAAQAMVCPGPARLDIHYLRPEVRSLGRAPEFFLLPSAAFHGMSRLGVRVCLHVLKCCLFSFLERLDDISSESLVPSSVMFDSFSSSAPSIFMPGLVWKRGWECWSLSLSTSLHGS